MWNFQSIKQPIKQKCGDMINSVIHSYDTTD